ncbi:MAG: hypothetical protein IJ075_06215 [Lachnospiraceae bacterium]|nr:hypothetical protein [Lachnospiraceae bacterium]MBQ9607466.1 hypothetical protein [Lachnospiraceae bacterium]
MDTIEKIREAELASEDAEKNAVVEADRIVAEAEDAAASLKVNLTKDAKAKADALLQDARTKSDSILSDAQAEAESEAKALRSDVSAKKGKAIKLILDDLTA